MPSKSSKSTKSSGSASGTRSRTRSRAACAPRPSTPVAAPQQPRDGVEGDLAGVRLAEGGEHLHTTAVRHRRHLAHQTALADARWPHHADHRAVAIDRAVQQALNGGHLPPPTDQIRLSTPDSAMPFTHAQQPTGGHRLVGTLDLNQLGLAEGRCALNQSRGGRAEHHPTRRSDRLHPLRHPDLLTDRGVTERPRTDLTGDHLTGVQAHPQPEVDTVAIVDLGREPLRLLLNAQGRQAGAEQRDPPT